MTVTRDGDGGGDHAADTVIDGTDTDTGTVKKQNFHTGLEPVSRTNNPAQPTEFNAAAGNTVTTAGDETLANGNGENKIVIPAGRRNPDARTAKQIGVRSGTADDGGERSVTPAADDATDSDDGATHRRRLDHDGDDGDDGATHDSRLRRRRFNHDTDDDTEDDSNAPMMAIFGGVFGLLLVFLVVVNLYSDAAERERLERGGEEGVYRIERLDGGSGFVVITFPPELRIIETGVSVRAGAVCDGGAFVDYARRVYENDGDQLVFFILEGSVPTMAAARECLRSLWPDQVLTIGWVMADNELLKSVALGDIPTYIRDYAERTP